MQMTTKPVETGASISIPWLLRTGHQHGTITIVPSGPPQTKTLDAAGGQLTRV